MTLLYFTQTGPPASGTRRKQNPERGNGRGRSRSEETRRVSTRAGRRVSPSRGRGGTRRASKSPGKRGHQSAGPPPPLVWRLVQKAQALMAKQTPCALGLSVGLAGPETLALPGRRLPVPACVCVEGDAPERLHFRERRPRRRTSCFKRCLLRLRALQRRGEKRPSSHGLKGSRLGDC